ncbi:MAG: ABC transporter permease [Alphaproteobacteria bacterium]|nr:ABC transporter permease [Alphaproteobacteria bacterium]
MQKITRNDFITEISGNDLHIIAEGSILNYDSDAFLHKLLAAIPEKLKNIRVTAQNLTQWDSSFLAALYGVVGWSKENAVNCDLSELPQNVQDLITLAYAVDRKPTHGNISKLPFLENLGKNTLENLQNTSNVVTFLGKICGAVGRFFTFRSIMRRVDFWSAMEDCGPKAVGIVALISFLVGLILAFVGAIQLQTFGAQIYVASLVTIGMCRIMGAIMVGIIMAGRTGSSYAATIGTMQVNEELDALQTMGLSSIDFLVLPRLFSLLIAMPILTMFADFAGMLGGAFVGIFMMDLPYQEYWKFAFDAFNLKNFLVGIFHGFCFGFIIAVCGCYSGLNCGRNADSVGVATTQSVVRAIVWMIVATGIITLICMELGI